MKLKNAYEIEALKIATSFGKLKIFRNSRYSTENTLPILPILPIRSILIRKFSKAEIAYFSRIAGNKFPDDPIDYTVDNQRFASCFGLSKRIFTERLLKTTGTIFLSAPHNTTLFVSNNCIISLLQFSAF
ncbi:MAG: hypothetical protein RL329_3520 [Bacteroidota bacterium]